MRNTCKGYYGTGFDDRTYNCNSEVGCGGVHCPANEKLSIDSGMGGLIDDVTAFKVAHDQPIPDKLHTPPIKRMNLLYDLMLEEFAEVTNSIYAEDGTYKLDHVALADGLADLVYVTVGMAIECGIPLDKVWAEVQRTNMAKIGPDGKFVLREDGKILKPDGWVGPDIKKAIGL